MPRAKIIKQRRESPTQPCPECRQPATRHPELPLHNNPGELAVRQRVRKRDVSFGPCPQEGRKAWDTFATLAATAKKLGVSFYAYVHDRVTGTHHIPPLAELVEQAAKELNLGWSWSVV